MIRRRLGLVTVLALVASGLVSVALPVPANATVTPVHALVSTSPITLLATGTGAGALRPHRWATFGVPSGVLTTPGHTIVLTVNVSSPTASGALGVTTSRTTSTPASALAFTARGSAGTTVLRAASSAHTLSVYNNSAGTAAVTVAAIGYTQPSPTETFHTTSRVMYTTTSLARGVWTTASAIGGTVPASATAVLVRLALTGKGTAGSLSVFTTPTATRPTSGQYAYAATGITRTGTIRGLSHGHLYFYNLRAPSVNLLATVVGYVTPTGVTGLKAISTSEGQVKLSWTNPANTTSVVVRRSDTSTAPATPASGSAVPLASLTSAIDTTTNGLPSGGASYSVFARTATQTFSPSTVLRPGPPVPTPTPSIGYPAGPGCNPSPGEVRYTWTQSGAVDHYIVSLSSKGGGVSIPPAGSSPAGIRLPGTARSYTGTGLEGRGEYGLTIYALDSANNFLTDLYIDCIAGDGTDQVPGPVSGVSATATPASVSLNWTNAPPHVVDSSTCDGYVTVSRADGNAGPSTPEGPTVIQVMSTYNATSVVDPTVLPGHTYTYSIWSMTCSWGFGTPTSYTITTPTGASPAAIVGLDAAPLPPSPTNSGQSIRLTWWTPATPPAGYLIARSIGTSSTSPTPPSSIYVNGGYRLSGTATSYTDAGLPANTHVAYAVWAVGADGSYSPVQTAITTTDPGLARTVAGHLINSATHATIGQSTTIKFTSDARTIEATTSALGAYSVQLPVDVYSVCVEGSSLSTGAQYGYFRTCTPLTVAATTSSFDVPADPKGAITGTVTDATTGQPIAGAVIDMPDPTGIQIGPFSPYLETKTGPDGTYRLIGAKADSTPTVSDGSPTLNGTATYTPTSLSAVTPTVPAGQSVVQNFTMTKLPTITISGTVTSSQGEAPVAGATVYFGNASGTNFYTDSTTTTSADGSYSETLALAPGASFQVCVDAESSNTGLTNQCFGGGDFDTASSPPQTIYGTATSITTTQTANLALQPLSTITGRVVGPTGIGIAGATVTPWITDRPDGARYGTTTDSQGYYTVHTPLAADMTNLQPRMCADATSVVDATSPGGYLPSSGDCSPAVSVSPVTPTNATPVTLQVPFGAAVSGVVTDPVTGAPLVGVHVTLDDKVTQTYDYYPSYKTVTDASGRYTFAGLDPSGVNITVGFDAFTGSTGVKYAPQTYQNASPSTLSLTAGQVTTADMQLDRAATIAGVVTDSVTHQALAGITVNSAGVGSAVTDASGHYAITGVPAPWANASVSIQSVVTGPGTGYQPADLFSTTTPGATTTMNLALLPAAEVDIRVVAPDGRPVAGANLEVSTGGFAPGAQLTDANGYLRYRGVTPFASPMPYLCAEGGQPGPGDSVGYTWGCVPMKMPIAGQVTTNTIVVGYDGRVVALVYDKSTGQPISGATVSFFEPDNPSNPRTGTTVNGFTDGDYGLPTAPGSAAVALPNPMQESPYRMCAQAPGYAPACADDDSSDGTSGSIFSPYPELATVATIGLTPN